MNKTELRINRILGQLNGVKKMMQAKRDCSAILLQISAIKAAVNNLGLEIAKDEACNLAPKNKEKLDQILKGIARI